MSTTAQLCSQSSTDLRLAGTWPGDEPGWPDHRVRMYLGIFIVLGTSMRLLRFGLKHPLWSDEAFLTFNLISRDFEQLTHPLDYQQVCPLLFLWAEKAIGQAVGFSEWTLRLLPTLASIASLFLFRHVAGRLLRGLALVIAVAFLAIAFTPIRHAGEIKPYATDFLVALGLIALAVEWLRTPHRTGFLWGLAALGPLAIGLSYPAVFVVGSVGLVLALPVCKSHSLRAIVPLAVFGVVSAGAFCWLLQRVVAAQSASVAHWMSVYWAGAFPPQAPLAFFVWLARTHTSQMFAYPGGGDHGASAITTGLVIAAIAMYLRRGSKPILALLLLPFALGMIAAALGRYPYGGSARTMQYVAPAILLMAGLGAAVLLAKLPGPHWPGLVSLLVMSTIFIVGIEMMAWDVTHPYKIFPDRTSREFARQFWRDESAGAELVCAKTDLRLPLDTVTWQGNRAANYLCYQKIYCDRLRENQQPRYDLVRESHPLRVVVFQETLSDCSAVSEWIARNGDRFELRGRRERIVNSGVVLGRLNFEERYVVYELAPGRLAMKPKDTQR
jgi:hypothetical protein